MEFTDTRVDLSRVKNFKEANAAGYPADLIGVYVGEATIGLPPFIKKDPQNTNPPGVEVVGRDLLIGTGASQLHYH